jgi:adenylate kinase
MRMVLLGPPGAGKGTQAAGLAQRAAVPHIATGDIFRANVAQGTRLGRRAQRYLDRGDLVPDEVVIAMVMDRLAERDCDAGFVLDGFPRTVAQAEALDRRLAELETPLDAALNFEVTEEELFRRLAGRSAELHRSDDTEQTIRHRLEVFAEKTRPLIDYYRHRGLLVGVDAVASIERVAARIDAALTALGVAAIVASV